MKMLLATDGSEYSIGAAQFLSRLRCSPDDEITLLYVIPEAPLSDAGREYYADLKKIKQEIAPRILDATVDKLRDVRAKINTLVASGHPDKAIIDTALLIPMDLIVLGARGIKGMRSFLLGSVTRATAIASPIPVLVIREPQWNASGPLKVLYATDGSRFALETGRLLEELPLPEGSEVTIMHVAGSSFADIPERFYLEMGDRVKEIAERTTEAEYGRAGDIMQNARELLAGKFPKMDHIIKHGDPSQMILDAAASPGADIIALGSSGMRGLRGMLGSVSRRVLGHAPCSVLIGKVTEG